MIRLERRLRQSRWMRSLTVVGSLIAASMIISLVLVVTGQSISSTFGSIATSGFGGSAAWTQTLVSSTPLVFTGLAAAVAFRVRLWNIGGEGQLYIGAISAAGVALVMQGAPGAITIVCTMIGGALGGLLWAAIPGLLRAYARTSEIVTTLMMNYIAGLVASFLIFGSDSFWRDTTSPDALVFPTGKTIPPSAWWPAVTVGGVTLPLGFIFGVVVAAVLWATFRWTRFGFEQRVIGSAPDAGRYAGIRTRRTLIIVIFISGALAGFGGATQIGDFEHLLDPNALQQSAFGYTGIVVAALARLEPIGIIASALLLGALTNVGFSLQGPHFPLGLTGIIEGVVLFCVIGADLLTRYRVRVDLGRLRQGPRDTGDASEALRVDRITAETTETRNLQGNST